MGFDIVEDFEKEIADFFGAPYAVATDSCTHALELCVRYTNPEYISVPIRTYLSVPMMLKKIHAPWGWHSEAWEDYYVLYGTNIIDAAVLWKPNSFIPNTYMCLSFQYKKHLSLGRGGAILCNNDEEYLTFKKMSYDGRVPYIPWAEQQIDTLGYHYYMTPETAQLGLDKLPEAIKNEPIKWSWLNYPEINNLPVFKNYR